ncbi:MAG: hypothetical protein Tsb009_10970 [Planctomycetaceae bacterium]
MAAYLGDDATVDLIRTWVQAACGDRTIGIPTGAPLSPILGNLFLDRFDEIVASRGARLVRYGDDFLMLFKDPANASAVLGEALREIEALELTLNDRAFATIDLTEPFHFLGFQFECSERWVAQGSRQPLRIEELGWHDAKRKKSGPQRLHLAGETGRSARDVGLTAIVGPGATHLEFNGGQLFCHYAGGRPKTEIPLADLQSIIAIGNLGINAQTLERLVGRNVFIWLADQKGEPFAAIQDDFDLPASVLQAQVAAAQDEQQRLMIAKAAVGAKIHNYGRLASVIPNGQAIAERLSAAADDARRTTSLQELLGTEGYAAALWYQLLSKSLAPGFSFEKRVAPNAHDPVNALLNIGHTWVHRMSGLAIRAAGLAPAIGFLHQANNRFAALASDMQESFRFLVDRAVIEATQELRPGDFRKSVDGPYPLTIAPSAVRRFTKLLWQTIYLEIQPSADGQPISYLVALERQARSLRRHLVCPDNPWHPFQLPG